MQHEGCGTDGSHGFAGVMKGARQLGRPPILAHGLHTRATRQEQEVKRARVERAQ